MPTSGYLRHRPRSDTTYRFLVGVGGGVMASGETVLAENTTVHIAENQGQIAIGNYIVQIGSIHGGVVNIAMPAEQPQLRPRPRPVLLRPRRFAGLLDRKTEVQLGATTLPAWQPTEFYGQPGSGKTSLLRHLSIGMYLRFFQQTH